MDAARWALWGRRVRRTVVVAAIVAGSIMGIDAFAVWLKEGEHLRVSAISVTGHHRVSRADAIRYAGAVPGDAMLGLDVDAMATGLVRHPWIRSAAVLRQWPNRLRLVLREYHPAMLVALGDVYMADVDGILFRRLTARDTVKLPVLTGLERSHAEGDAVGVRARIRDAIAVADGCTAAGHGAVDAVDWDSFLGWRVVLIHDNYPRGVRVHLGFDWDARLPGLQHVLARLKAADQVPTVIWLDGTKDPGRVHVRLAG